MAALWYPRAIQMPGARAGYDRGRNAMRCCVMHYTVGRDSTNIGLDGYFTFLVSRDGLVKQFCPVDALCWHAGEWNPDGPGIEHEFYEPVDGPAPANILTAAQEKASGALCVWLRDEHGIPGRFYDGPRINRGYSGFITHRSLIQSQGHSDYITAEQWQRMTSSGSSGDQTEIKRRRTVAAEGNPTMDACVTFGGHSHYFTRAPDGRLAHVFYSGKNWYAEDVNKSGGHPEFRLKDGASIVARTKELHGSENGLDVGWTGSLGENGHTFYNAPNWGAELLPALQ